MKIDLSKYLDNWYKEDPAKKIFSGPVVTLSREVGCPAKTVAADLSAKLNTLKKKHSKDHPWIWIDKEIMMESAKELQVHSNQIQHVFDYKKRGVLEDQTCNNPWIAPLADLPAPLFSCSRIHAGSG